MSSSQSDPSATWGAGSKRPSSTQQHWEEKLWWQAKSVREYEQFIENHQTSADSTLVDLEAEVSSLNSQAEWECVATANRTLGTFASKGICIRKIQVKQANT